MARLDDDVSKWEQDGRDQQRRIRQGAAEMTAIAREEEQRRRDEAAPTRRQPPRRVGER